MKSVIECGEETKRMQGQTELDFKDIYQFLGEFIEQKWKFFLRCINLAHTNAIPDK